MKADNARRRLLGFETDNKSSYWIRSVTKDVLKNVAKFTQKNLSGLLKYYQSLPL